ERLQARGGGESKLKDLLMRVGGAGFLLFARAQPDTPGKLVAHAYSYEHMELAAYDLLSRVAERADDTETVELAHRIRDEEDRLDARGGDSSSLKDTAMRAGALNWGMFFQTHPDTPGKLACFAYAFEHLEIAGYEELKRVAQRVGDEETVAAAERILSEERDA